MNVVAEFVRFDNPLENVLRITENKRGLRGSILHNFRKVKESVQFNYKDCDADIYRVKEYFGFTEENSFCINKRLD